MRLAIGQVLDYQYLHPEPKPGTAILVPDKPPADLLGLLDDLAIGCIWRHGTGFTDSSGRRHLTR